MKIRILFDKNDNVLKVVEVDTDIDKLITDFIVAEMYGKLVDIEYWEGGSYDLIKNEDEYDIFISGDNGIFEMYTDTYEVEGVEDHVLIKTINKLEDDIAGKDIIIDNLHNQVKVLLDEIKNLMM